MYFGLLVCSCGRQANTRCSPLCRKKNKGWVIKLDFKKAYDRVDWGFLLDVLKKISLDIDGGDG